MASNEIGDGRAEPLVEQEAENPQGLSRRRFLKGGVIFLGGAVAGAAVLGGTLYLKREDLIEWVLGGQTDYYTQLAWQRLEVSSDAQPHWESFPRDPEATSEDPADWTKLGLIAVNSEALDDQRRRLGAVEAVAYKETDTLIHIGTMATGKPFFTSVKGDPHNYVVGLRIGPSDLLWTPGLWLPEDRKFVEPEAGIVRVGTVDIATLQQTYPGAGYAMLGSDPLAVPARS